MARLITVKEAVSQASLEIGLTQRPVTAVVNSADQDIVQMGALLSAVADEVLTNEPYEQALGDGMWLLDPATGAMSDQITADEQRICFDGRLAINGLKFRFLQSKGLEFGEQLRDFTVRMNGLASKANGRVLDLDNPEERVQ